MSAVASVFAAFGVVAPAEAAVDYFLEINGVQGESQDAKFAKSVDILSYSWGASTSDKKGVSLQDLSITKPLDLASPPLFQRLVQGTSIPSMELIGRKAGETQQIFLRFCFQDVRVTSLQQSGTSGGDTPTENVTFGYTSVSEAYTAGNPDGKAGQTVFAGWNSSTGDLIGTYPNPCGF